MREGLGCRSTASLRRGDRADEAERRSLVMHFDEARKNTVAVLLQNDALLDRSVLINDIYDRIRVAVWFAGDIQTDASERLREELSNAAGPFWAGDLWVANRASEADQS